MKLAHFFCLLCLFSFTVALAEEIKHLTVNDYLQHEKASGKKENQLIGESSPYLLQHAYNPVNWYAWGEDAFEKARKEKKPIFLSIGYSTCHWCHVMAHESFEDEKIAALLNKHFVSIKVDREQRPDIDSVYMAATQLINGSGGWPMTVFLDHDLRPFHAATYYPPFSTDGRLGLQEVLLKIHELWVKQPETINEVATSVTARISVMADDTIEGGILSHDINRLAMQQVTDSFDEDMGGFSAAPKFPRPGIFSFLNSFSITAADHVVSRADANAAQKMMRITLDAMASGGIYDQLAGGFHRYSVDADWQVPHFEKMLYSQALMVMAYNDYYEADPQEKYKKIIYQTLGFVKKEMRSPDGGFYSALDADSERTDEAGNKSGKKAEGAYYLWRQAELKQLLTKDEFDFIKKYFHIREHGNIFSDPQKEFTDLNIFYIDEEHKNQSLTKQQESWLASAKKKLNKKRRLRPRPQLDDKVITAWNGMLVSAFSKASITFDDKSLLGDALQILSYAKNHLYDDSNKKLLRQHRDTKTGAGFYDEAILADYVWLVAGLLEVYEAGKDKQWLNWAMALHEKQNELFLDPATGAYFESTTSDENLLFRSKSIFDGALPSANAIALSNLRKFSRLSKKQAHRKVFSAQADKLVSSFATVINQNPASASMLLAVEVLR
ncbi:MAG: thioredoxin domain-containing protein [Gammaproteobacteria bacterium]|nr:thioredoxin domain-containing protein [Gammaproteobacteria bacterium]